MANETIEIRCCPHCRGTHRYKLDVGRAIIMRMMTTPDVIEQPHKVKVTRLFICPDKNEQYQGTFYLQETSSNRIKNVQVVGLSEVPKDD